MARISWWFITSSWRLMTHSLLHSHCLLIYTVAFLPWYWTTELAYIAMEEPRHGPKTWFCNFTVKRLYTQHYAPSLSWDWCIFCPLKMAFEPLPRPVVLSWLLVVLAEDRELIKNYVGVVREGALTQLGYFEFSSCSKNKCLQLASSQFGKGG